MLIEIYVYSKKNTNLSPQLIYDLIVLENSSEAGVWYHLPDVGKDLVLTHPTDPEDFICIIEPPIIGSFLYFAKPVNPLFSNVLR